MTKCNSREEVVEMLKSWGVTKRFKPYRDLESDAVRWLLLVRRPARIVAGGELDGTEIYVDEAEKCLRVWTSQKRLAREMAVDFGLKVRMWDAEAEVWVGPAVAGAVLPRFGAKVKREMSPEDLARLKARLAKVA
jgi:hypothetical protein